ncbi:methyl-accepting chemotaxis protein [uncultured Sphingomonas sp.]|uniref:methyl-accepting chemotaxis protein n=1 Tax=uncultured Sphingomonas sp. TaxID=158754 RepID=UPI00258C3FDA|nr:methyl-accepting chemotaxis protein [uncultured Sphingomonas sp.]
MKNLSVSNKLLVSFAVLLVAMIAMMAMSMTTQRNLNATADELGRFRRDNLIAITSINTAASDYRIAEAASILAIDDTSIAAAERGARNQLDIIEKNDRFLQKSLRSPVAIATFREFRAAWATFLVGSRETLARSHAGKDAEALANFRETEKLFRRGNGLAQKMQDIQVRLMDEAMTEANSSYAWSRNISIAIAIAVLILTGVILTALVRGIAHPLRAMTDTMGRLAAGDLTAQVPVDVRRDEVGQLAGSIAAFRNQLAAAERSKEEHTTLIVDSVGTGLSALAQGDLTARIDAELVGPFAKLKSDFNAAMDAVSSALGAVTESAQGITNGASDIRQASDDLSRRTEQQAASLEETAAAMHEISSTVRETAQNAHCANDVVATTRSDAERSGEVVRRAVEAMNGIERSSAEISEIIAVIDGIAFQTNLLALNAGVEAARAGDAGKGFAVVASEVRALAQRSADAAKDVKTKITASGEQVNAGVALVGQAGEALTSINARIVEINTLVSDIAAAAEQQSVGLQQINTAVSEMDGVTQQNAAMVEEATAAARSLASETQNMARQIARFRLDQRGGPVSSAPVHQLQARVAQAGPRIAAAARPRGGAAAAVAAQDDWEAF